MSKCTHKCDGYIKAKAREDNRIASGLPVYQTTWTCGCEALHKAKREEARKHQRIQSELERTAVSTPTPKPAMTSKSPGFGYLPKAERLRILKAEKQASAPAMPTAPKTAAMPTQAELDELKYYRQRYGKRCSLQHGRERFDKELKADRAKTHARMDREEREVERNFAAYNKHIGSNHKRVR